jgi:hypothetical protein
LQWRKGWDVAYVSNNIGGAAMTIQETLQILGGAGVITSISYTGYQIRRNTIAQRALANQTISLSFVSMWMDLAQNAEFTELLLRGGDDFDGLTRLEKARLRFSMMSYMRTYENAFFQHKVGILKDQDWDAIVGDMESYCSRKSTLQVWTLVRDRSSKDFATLIDKIIATQMAKVSAAAEL